MTKGASIKFISYHESVPKILDLLNLKYEIKKYDKIVIKPNLTSSENAISPAFIESVLRFCLENKNPITEVFIAEGVDSSSTEEIFHSSGLSKLAERYNISLIDLNIAETETIERDDFIKFNSIEFPKILKDAFIISVSKASENEETSINGTLSNMLGAFPASHYKGFFSKTKNKIRKWPIKYSIHDILKCKMPDFAIVDASEKGIILAGLPFEIDKQMAKLLGKEWQRVPYLNLMHEQVKEFQKA